MNICVKPKQKIYFAIGFLPYTWKQLIHRIKIICERHITNYLKLAQNILRFLSWLFSSHSSLLQNNQKQKSQFQKLKLEIKLAVIAIIIKSKFVTKFSVTIVHHFVIMPLKRV